MFGGSIMSNGGDSGVFGFMSSAEIIKINLKDMNYETLSVELLEKRSHHAVVELNGTFSFYIAIRSFVLFGLCHDLMSAIALFDSRAVDFP